MSKYTRKVKELISVPVTHFLSRGDFFLNGRQRVLRTSNDPVIKTLLHRSSVVIQGGWRTTKARLHSGQQLKNRTKREKNLVVAKNGSMERDGKLRKQTVPSLSLTSGFYLWNKMGLARPASSFGMCTEIISAIISGKLTLVGSDWAWTKRSNVN